MLVLDYEKARELVLSALEGKVSTVTATRVILALKGATIEAAPVVHGRCKFCEDYDKFGEIVCYLPTENGDSIPVPLNYCPNCGARMDGDTHV